MNKATRFPHLFPKLTNPEAAQDLLIALAHVKSAATMSGPLGMTVKVYSQETETLVMDAIKKATSNPN